MTERYDAIVIGAGQAGPALAARLDREGLKTAMVERKLLGGTCVNVGCIPTKTLVASAHAIHMARRGGEYGFAVGDIKVDMAAVKGRKDKVVKHSSDGVAGWIAGMTRWPIDVVLARSLVPLTRGTIVVDPTDLVAVAIGVGLVVLVVLVVNRSGRRREAPTRSGSVRASMQ